MSEFVKGIIFGTCLLLAVEILIFYIMYRNRYGVSKINIVEVDEEEMGVKYIATSLNYYGLIGGGNTKREAKKILIEAIEMCINDEYNDIDYKLYILYKKYYDLDTEYYKEGVTNERVREISNERQKTDKKIKEILRNDN